MSTTVTKRSFAGHLLRFGIAAVTTAALTFGGVQAANAAPGDLLVSGGPTLTTATVTGPGAGTATPTNTLAAGNKLRVTGSGFNSTTAEGVYVSFGWVNASNWRPSAGAPSTNRATKQTVWVRSGTVPAGATDQVNWTTTGAGTSSFTLDINPLQAPRTNPSGNDVFYVYAVNGHNVANASNEQAREVNFAGAKDTSTPPSSGGQGVVTTTPETATTVRVNGSGFTGAPATGVYVSLGLLDNAGWKPSAGFGSATRAASDTVWTYGAGPATQAGGAAKLNADGTFSIVLSKASVPAATATKHRAAYTVGAHGIVRALSEAETTIP